MHSLVVPNILIERYYSLKFYSVVGVSEKTGALFRLVHFTVVQFGGDNLASLPVSFKYSNYLSMMSN